jgi:hypothetical protein
MGDLADALMVLSREANGRRQARKQLREAVTTIGTAMLDAGLRAGDRVYLHEGTPGGNFEVVSVTWPVSQWANDVSPFLCPEPKNTLVFGTKAVLVDVRGDYHDGSNLHHPVGRTIRDAAALRSTWDEHDDEPDPFELRLATDEELVQFCRNAAIVARKFAELLAEQERSFTAAAQAVTKLVPADAPAHHPAGVADRHHQRRMEATANAEVSWSTPTLTQPPSVVRS